MYVETVKVEAQVMKHSEMVKLMGMKVLVSKILERDKGLQTVETRDTATTVILKGLVKAWWEEKEIEPRTGWVVGFRAVQEGYVEPGSKGYYGIDGLVEDEPSEWRTTGVKKCLLVAFWPTEKPVHVPLDGYVRVSRGGRYIDPEWIRKGPQNRCHIAPEPYAMAGGWHGNPDWREKNAEFMKDEMKDWPRDEKGRWRKKSADQARTRTP